MTDHHDLVTTFYSYKSGVGRSMTLANIAYVLATRGRRVLAIDWDLESPGLGYYLGDAATARDHPGLLDAVFAALDAAARGEPIPDDGFDFSPYITEARKKLQARVPEGAALH